MSSEAIHNIFSFNVSFAYIYLESYIGWRGPLRGGGTVAAEAERVAALKAEEKKVTAAVASMQKVAGGGDPELRNGALTALCAANATWRSSLYINKK